MILYKVKNSIRDFVLSDIELSEDLFYIVSDNISNSSTLNPIISTDIIESISSVSGDFLSDGFSIEILKN